MAFGNSRAFSGPGAYAFNGGQPYSDPRGYRPPATPPPQNNDMRGYVPPTPPPPQNNDLRNYTPQPPAQPQSTQRPPVNLGPYYQSRLSFTGNDNAPAGAGEGAPVGVVDSNNNVGVSVTTGTPTPYEYPPTPTSTAPPGDYDISQPGMGEKAVTDNLHRFFDEGPYAQWYKQHAGDLAGLTPSEQLYAAQQALGPMKNYAEREYLGYKRPDIAAEPGFGSYYDNAEKNVVKALGRELAAIGSYGSSVGLGQIGKSVGDLRADQARHEAQYNLDRLGEQRAWEELGGTLAREADASGRANIDTMSGLARDATSGLLDRFKTGAAAAETGDTTDLARITGGINAALGGQGAREGRIETGRNAIQEASQGLMGIIGGNWDKLLSGDQELFDAINQYYLGKTREDANWASSQEGRLTSDIMNMMQMGTSAYMAAQNPGGAVAGAAKKKTQQTTPQTSTG